MQSSIFSVKTIQALLVLLVVATAGAQGQVKSTISGTITDATGGVGARRQCNGHQPRDQYHPYRCHGRYR